MTLTRPDRYRLLRLALASIALALLIGRTAIASEVTEPIEELHAGLIAIMKAGKSTSFRQRYEMIAPVVGRTFDLDAILHQVIGPRWAGLPLDQKNALEDAFRRYTTASYVANFGDFGGQRFEIMPTLRAAGADRMVVATRILTPSGQAHRLDYVLRQEAGGWKIVDVLAEGSISRVAAQHSEIRSLLSAGGGNALLVSLRQKTAELSGGILQ